MGLECVAGWSVALWQPGVGSAPSAGETLPWLAVAALGGLVGSTEIIGRYRDEPVKCLFTPPGIVYVIVNMLASLSAYALAGVFHWTIDLSSSSAQMAGGQSASAAVEHGLGCGTERHGVLSELAVYPKNRR